MSAGKDLPALTGPGTMQAPYTSASQGKDMDQRNHTQVCSLEIENALNTVSICTTARTCRIEFSHRC